VSPQKPRQTQHRTASDIPDVKERIKKLKRLWKRASFEERTNEVVELLGVGCSIRGLAHDLGESESTVRQYSKVKPDKAAAAETVLQNRNETAEPFDAWNGSIPASTSQKPTPHQSVSRTTTDKLPSHSVSKGMDQSLRKVGPLSRAALKKIVLPPRPSRQPQDQKETLPVLSQRSGQIIVDLIRAECSSMSEQDKTATIQAALETARTFITLGRHGAPRPILPLRLTADDLLEKTRPTPRDDQPRSDFVGRWVAGILNSLNRNNELVRMDAIDAAEKQLIPEEPRVVRAKPFAQIRHIDSWGERFRR